MASYKETDMKFYGAEPMELTEFIPRQHGNLLKWNKKQGVSGYAIYRKEIGVEGWELVVTLDQHVTHFLDTQPLNNSIYDYRIEAIVEGDFMLGDPDAAGGQDFALTKEVEAAEQDMLNRIRTQKGDWRSHQNLGADLELLEGEPNIRETGERGEEAIREALTYDGRFLDQDVEVRAVPVRINQIDFYTMLDHDDNAPLVIQTLQNL